MDNNDFKQLVKSIDKVLVWSSVPLIVALVLVNLSIESYITSKSLVNLIQSVTAGIIPVFLLFIGSYIVLKKIQDIKKLSEKNDLIQEITNECKPIHEEQDRQRELINEVFRYLKRDTMNLIQYERERLVGRGYYDKLYDGKKVIYISGVTISSLISSMLCDNRTEDNLLSQLLRSENVKVRIMCLHPTSHFAEALNEQEHISGASPTPVTDQICETISKIKTLSEDNRDPERLPFGSSLEIAVTSDPITSAITYAAEANNSDKNTLLMGFIFPYKKGGPMYQIPKRADNQLHKDLLESFEWQFREAKRNHLVLSWAHDHERRFNDIRCDIATA